MTEREIEFAMMRMTTAELNAIPGHKVKRIKAKRCGDTGQPVYCYECECGFVSRISLHWNSARAAIDCHLAPLRLAMIQGER